MDRPLWFELSTEETNLILQALGQLPYVKVAELINKIQEQAAPQLLQEAQKKKGEAEALPSFSDPDASRAS